MNRMKKTIRNIFVQYKIPIIVSVVIIISIVGGLIINNKNKQVLNHNEIKQYVKKQPKSIDELTENEKEILGTEDKKNEIDKEIEKNYSEDYKKYEKLTEEEKKKIEVVPRKEDIPINEIDEIKEEIDYNKEKTIPENYNLKDHIHIKVENQANYGLCWDFASMNSLETNIALHEGRDLDLSELHLDYYQSNLMYGYRTIHNGGNFSDFVDYSLLSGAVLEETVPYGFISKNTIEGKEYTYFTTYNYKEEDYSKFTSMDTVARATEVVDFPSIRKTNGVISDKKINEEKLNEYRKTIKYHIMKNGSIYTVIRASNDYNSYCNDNCVGDHAVSIVGWDDNYSKDNFTSLDGSKPIHDGAYIVLNSWGEKGKGKGYYYISYDDQLVESQMSGVISASMDNAIKIESIQNQYVKDIIRKELKYYILNYNNEDYITKIALGKVNYIDLKNKNITSDDLSGLEIFKNLYGIDLSDNKITDISALSNLNKLSYINLSNNNVTDVSLLKNIENLGNIDLSGNNNVTGYEYLKNLYKLSLSNTNLITLNDISNNEGLFELDLSNNTQLDYTNLKLPKNITNLVLDNTNLANYNFHDLNKLYSLSIKNNNLKNLNLLKNINSLYYLDVSNNEIIDFSAIENIFNSCNEECTSQEYSNLTANFNNISDISIINNIKVDKLSLSNNHITDLSNYKNNNVKEIILSYNKIEKGIKELKNINSLTIDNCGISNLKEFSELENVNSINLNDNNISSLKDLKNLKQLYSLSLNNNHITDLSELFEFENLYNLSIDYNDITDITPLNKIKTLNSLSLEGNKKIQGKLIGDITNINIKDCNVDNSFDLSGLTKLNYIDINNNNYNYNDIKNIIKNNKSEWIYINADKLEISEEQLHIIDEQSQKERNININGGTLNLTMNIDSNNNINLENKYYIRKILMQQLRSNNDIENGTIDNKVEFIHVINPDNKKISFISNYSLKNYGLTNINILY